MPYDGVKIKIYEFRPWQEHSELVGFVSDVVGMRVWKFRATREHLEFVDFVSFVDRRYRTLDL